MSGKRKAAKKSVADFADETMPEVEPADVQALKRELRRLHREARRRDGRTQLIVDHIREVLEGSPPPQAPRKPAKSRKARKEYALLHLSDWQTGARTTTFDTEVLREMIEERLVPKVRKIVEARRSSAALDEIHIVLGGDQVDGSGMRANHPWEVTEHVLTQSMETCPRITANMVLGMMDLFPEVHVHAIRGNHGRSGPRKADPNPSSVNWDTVASMAAKLMLGPLVDGKRLTFDVEVEDFLVNFRCGGARVMAVHGDQFSGSGGFAGLPLYAITRMLAKWALNLDADGEFDALIFGHFHVPASGMFGPKSWYLNGSTQTDSPFARERIGSTNVPCQRLLIFGEDSPRAIADHLVWLDS
jgi:hypothetical protein